MAGFDPQDKASWYFGPMSRDDANKIFHHITDEGVFLVRESNTRRDDFVLCVKEGPKICHYIVEKVTHDNGYMFKIGDQTFPDIPAMLAYYQKHVLDTTRLTMPAPREKVCAKYDFPGQDDHDLPFRKGEVMEVITKDEERWWTARNQQGRIGQIPVTYVTPFVSQNNINNNNTSHQTNDSHNSSLNHSSSTGHPIHEHQEQEQHHVEKQLPAKALVKRNRIPNQFDKTQLRLTEGEIVMVTEINPGGRWKGQIGDREGYFPYTHVEFVDN